MSLSMLGAYPPARVEWEGNEEHRSPTGKVSYRESYLILSMYVCHVVMGYFKTRRCYARASGVPDVGKCSGDFRKFEALRIVPI